MREYIENKHVIIVQDDQQRKSVVEFMLENNISFQEGFSEEDRYDARDIAQELGVYWESSYC